MGGGVGSEPQAESRVCCLLAEPSAQPLQRGHPADSQVAVLEHYPAALPCCCLDQLLSLQVCRQNITSVRHYMYDHIVHSDAVTCLTAVQEQQLLGMALLEHALDCMLYGF